jgi:lipoprotein-anchoring transpeptidase ErfK/SrfK
MLVAAVVIAFIYGNHWFGKGESEYEPAAPLVSEVSETETEPEPQSGLDEEPVEVTAELAAPVEQPALTEVTAESTEGASPQVGKIISEAVELVNASPDKIVQARERLNEALSMPMSEQQRSYIKQQLSRLADTWLLSQSVFPQDRLCDSYKVQPGDRLEAVGKEYKVPYEILMQINNITRPEALQAGETVKVINGPFHAKVFRSAFTMDLYLQDTYIRTFRVGLGKPGMETPLGLWLVAPGGKLIKPAWTDRLTGKTYRPDDPDYPLGSRWIGLDGIEGPAKGRTGFAIHGTTKPEEIGTAGSQGCIRMHNGDVILVYKLLMPGHSKVRVVE